MQELITQTGTGEDPLAAVLLLCDLIPDRFEYRKGATYVDSKLVEVLDGGAGVCQDFVHLAISVLRHHGIAARYVSGYLFTTGEEDEDGADDGLGGLGGRGGRGGGPEGEERRSGELDGRGGGPDGEERRRGEPGGRGRPEGEERRRGDHESVEVDTHAWLEALLAVEDGEPSWVSADPTNRGLAGERHVKIGHGRHYADVPPIRASTAASPTPRSRRPSRWHGSTAATRPRSRGPSGRPGWRGLARRRRRAGSGARPPRLRARPPRLQQGDRQAAEPVAPGRQQPKVTNVTSRLGHLVTFGCISTTSHQRSPAAIHRGHFWWPMRRPRRQLRNHAATPAVQRTIRAAAIATRAGLASGARGREARRAEDDPRDPRPRGLSGARDEKPAVQEDDPRDRDRAGLAGARGREAGRRGRSLRRQGRGDRPLAVDLAGREREARARQLLGHAPQPACVLGVLGRGRARDERGPAAQLLEAAGPDEAVAGMSAVAA